MTETYLASARLCLASLALVSSLVACADDGSSDDEIGAETDTDSESESDDTSSESDESSSETESTETTETESTETETDTDTSETETETETDTSETDTGNSCEDPGTPGPVDATAIDELPWPEFFIDGAANFEVLPTSESFMDFFQSADPYPDEWVASLSTLEPFPHASLTLDSAVVSDDPACSLTLPATLTLPGPSCETFETPMPVHAGLRFPAPFVGDGFEAEPIVATTEIDCERDGVGEFETCSQTVPCAPGLLCAGITRWDEGLCMDASLRGRFDVDQAQTIPANGQLLAELDASGLATVDMDVIVFATLDHPDPAALTITLTNPSGNEVMVWDNEEGPSVYPWFGFDGQFALTRVPTGFSGDEDVNGTWFLTVTDTDGGGGELLSWGVEIMSRWD